MGGGIKRLGLWVVMRFDDFRGVGGHDRHLAVGLGGRYRTFADVQAEAPGVRAVAGEALVREERANVTIKLLLFMLGVLYAGGSSRLGLVCLNSYLSCLGGNFAARIIVFCFISYRGFRW